MESIGLEDLDKVSLLNRVDSKYVIAASLLPEIMNDLKSEQYILEINGVRNFDYETHYFDTKDYNFYLDHHNGCINRVKVRTRSYIQTNNHFYEVKQKIFGTRTNKIRKAIPELPTELVQNDIDMIVYQRYNGEKLELQLKNNFKRITLTNKNFTERITIDTQIRFIKDEKIVKLPHIAIIEVKQSKLDYYSHTMSILKKYHIRNSSFSKYSIGIALTTEHLKKNNFKPIILKLNSIKNAQG